MPPLALPTEQHRDAEELANIIIVLQRCFLMNLSKELSNGNVSFAQYFLLGHLDQSGVATMSEIALKMGHTTAAATGLVDRLENLGYITRCHCTDDRRKVIVKITEKGQSLVHRIREDMVRNVQKVMEHLTPDEQSSWLHIYQKIFQYCQSQDHE
ncbi:MAG: MarR family transcriptional regulator [Chthoniobacterales bacterium]